MTIPTHILWDNDGVLVDTEPLYFHATQRALAELGVSLTAEIYRQFMVTGSPTWVLASRNGVAYDTISQAQMRRDEYYQALLGSETFDIAGASTVLTSLARSYHMAIVTTCRAVDFALIHTNNTFTRHMDFVLTREHYTLSKPHAEPYETALKRFGITPDKAVVVEDSQRGLTAAVAAGIRCVAVHNTFTAGQDFSQAHAHIGSLAELPGYLAGLGGDRPKGADVPCQLCDQPSNNLESARGYGILVCRACWLAAANGWPANAEARLKAGLAREGRFIPDRNMNGRWPREWAPPADYPL